MTHMQFLVLAVSPVVIASMSAVLLVVLATMTAQLVARNATTQSVKLF